MNWNVWNDGMMFHKPIFMVPIAVAGFVKFVPSFQSFHTTQNRAGPNAAQYIRQKLSSILRRVTAFNVEIRAVVRHKITKNETPQKSKEYHLNAGS